MLRIHQSSSVKAVLNYYNTELSRCQSEYYSKGNEAGLWFGKAAGMLGLEGAVKKEDFHMLCENRRPDTGEKLNPRDNPERKPGYDFTYNAPKSVSVAFSVLGDNRILDVFRQAVRETMSYVESEAHVRVRKGGVVDIRKTGNILWSEHIHYQSRPCDDGLTCPQLHCHAYVHNSSRDLLEGRFKAGEFFPIVRDAVYYEAIFQNLLAQGLKKLGYQIENRPFSFEIAGIGAENLKRFSRRTKEIEELAKKLGISGNGAAMAKLGALTRNNKKTQLKGVDKLAEWRSRFDWDELNLEQEQAPQPEITAKQAVALAIENSFERRSVMQLRRLVANALQLSLGDCTFEEIVAEIRSNEELVIRNVDGVSYATTKEIIEEEKAIRGFLKRTKSSVIPMLAWYREKSDNLDNDQCVAVEAIMHSRDRVICIQGRAGSGKTTMMKTAIAAMHEVGVEALTFAPTSSAVQVLKSEGFANSETVQQLLVNPELQKKMQGKLLWIDEAALLSAREMSQLVSIVDRQNAKLILGGDSRQNPSIGRGSVFGMMCDSALVTVKETRSIYRQRNVAYKQAVTALSLGDASGALEILDDMGSIKEISNFEERLQVTASEYVESLDKHKTVLAVSPTHLEGRLLTNEIRSLMREKGKLGTDELSIPVYRNRNLTEAQRKLVPFYREGDIIRFHQNAKGGFAKADIAKVISKDDRGIYVQKAGEKEMRLLDLETAKHFGVFDESSINVSVGDRMRITRNALSANGKRLLNGNIYHVTSISSNGGITLDDRYQVNARDGLLDYGMVSTSYASQGKTCEKVIISQSSLSFDASSLESFYVGVSRGRDDISIMTDSVAGLLDAVSDPANRMLATELENQRIMEEEEIQAALVEPDTYEMGII